MPQSSNQKGFAHILVVLVVLIGIGIGVYLATHPQIFKSRAALTSSAITFSGSSVSPDQTTTTSPQVNLTIHYVPPPITPPDQPAIQRTMQLTSTLANAAGASQGTFTGFTLGFGVRGTDSTWKQLPGYAPYDSQQQGWWDETVSEAERAGVDFVAPVTRGCNPGPDSYGNIGNGCPTDLNKLVTAINHSTASTKPKIALFVDTGGAFTILKNIRKGHGYTITPPFDFGDSSGSGEGGWQYFWDDDIKIFFQTIPQSQLFEINGKPVVFFWTANSPLFTNQSGNLSKFLTYIRQQVKSMVGTEPYVILDQSWPALDPTITPSLADGVNNWFDPNVSACTIRDWNGRKFAVSVPAFIDPTNPSRSLPRSGGQTLASCLTQIRQAGTYVTLLEGLTDVEESAGYYRSKDSEWSYPDLYLDIVRRSLYPSQLNTPPPSTPPFPTSFRIAGSEAELANAKEQIFDQNDKVIPYTLPSGNGAKTIFAQFKVGGAWENPISSTITLSIPSCNSGITCSSSCSAPNNTCGEGNGTQTNCKYTTGTSGCLEAAAPDQKCSLSNCSRGYQCSSVSCVLPNCTQGIVCTGECQAPSNTCGETNGTKGSCKYTTLPSGTGDCTQTSAPDQKCSADNCSGGYQCVSGGCAATPVDTTLSVDKLQVTLGGSYTLSWSSSNATSCTSSTTGEDTTLWTGALSTTSGQISLTPKKAGAYTHTFSCTNSQNNQSSQMTKEVTVVLPNCTKGVVCTGACTATSSNTCSENNGTEGSCKYITLDDGSSSCSPSAAPDQKCSLDNCSEGYSCSSGICVLPQCDSAIVCSGSCTAPSNTCRDSNGTQGSCQYTKLSNSQNKCAPSSAPDQKCSVSNCQQGYSCLSGQCMISFETNTANQTFGSQLSTEENSFTSSSQGQVSTSLNQPIQAAAQPPTPQSTKDTPQLPQRGNTSSTPQTAFDLIKQRGQANPVPETAIEPTPQVSSSSQANGFPSVSVPKVVVKQLPVVGGVVDFFNNFNNFLDGRI